ncbi:YncE family protein [Nocardioides aurantiacus]|uniref:YVTN family beta-propeller protein n=1 Tax=Nocardioides aurantiacus TaxID=86796 RepID=A0A3N2CXT1_9ACTN|nr:YncE family protein [Nocardioides aurantiacus]ROR92352.1 YVTN family beta-propeller protein [Nocardioides aurantiacus]
MLLTRTPSDHALTRRPARRVGILLALALVGSGTSLVGAPTATGAVTGAATGAVTAAAADGSTTTCGPVECTVTFDYTGEETTWIVPTGVTSARVVARGAEGGTSLGYDRRPGGKGAVVTATVPMSGGQRFLVTVGGTATGPANTTGGWGGTAPGGPGWFEGVEESPAGGGGASGMTLSPYENVRVVAGGGGGAGGHGVGSASKHGGAGGPSGSNGSDGDAQEGDIRTASGGGGGKAGTTSAGGAGGAAGVGVLDYWGGSAGQSAQGRWGAPGAIRSHLASDNRNAGGGGGGGGGYFGGGGGGTGGVADGAWKLRGSGGGGGGGGSSFTTPGLVTDASIVDGAHTGNGQISITYRVPITTPTLVTKRDVRVEAGRMLVQVASLEGGHQPTGDIRFRLYGPSDPTCSGTPLSDSTRSLSAQSLGSVFSAYVRATRPGTHRWSTTYAGNEVNRPVSQLCTDASEVVPGPPATLVMTPATSSVTAGGRQAYRVVGTDAYGNLRGDDTATTEFSIAGGGTCTQGPQAGCTSLVPGTHQVRAVNGAASTTGQLVVEPLRVGVDGALPTGTQPQSVAVDPTTHRAFVANSGSDTVSVLDGVTGALVATVPVGDYPTAVAVDPTTHAVYVSNLRDGTLSILANGGTGTVSTVAVGPYPLGVGVDQGTGTAYVANSGSSTVTVVRDRRAVATVRVGSRPLGLDVDPTTHRVYVANSDAGTVSVIDGASNAVTATVDLGLTRSQLVDVTVDRFTRDVYVADREGGRVHVIDAATDEVTGSLAAGTQPSGVAVDPGTRTTYVTDAGSDEVTVLDQRSGQVLDTLGVGRRPTSVAVDPTTHTAFVTNFDDGTVSVLRLADAARPVVFTSTPPSPALHEGSYTPTAVGPDPSRPVRFSIGATSDLGTCAIDDAGVVSFTGTGRCVVEADQSGTLGSASAAGARQTVIVSAAPRFVSADPPLRAAHATPYTAAFRAAAYPSPTYSLVGAPGFLSIDPATGRVSGTPDAPDAAYTPATFSYAVRAENPVGAATTETFTVSVSPQALPGGDPGPQEPGPLTPVPGGDGTDPGDPTDPTDPTDPSLPDPTTSPVPPVTGPSAGPDTGPRPDVGPDVPLASSSPLVPGAGTASGSPAAAGGPVVTRGTTATGGPLPDTGAPTHAGVLGGAGLLLLLLGGAVASCTRRRPGRAG